MTQSLTSAEIRQQFIDFFVEKHGHTQAPSASLVPGGDATLLFTNAGMVQFKDVFLGADKRPYNRAVNSQKCMRVAGKHNDLEDVGQDDTHHTFFEMLGNWSFGDYYKKEAIAWAWELLTEVWGLPKDRFYASVFKDELGEIPTDEDAVKYWKEQPGFDAERIVYLGRKDNFWEMADTGPCGPNSEIHDDLGPDFAEIEYMPDGQIDLDNGRFVELWNLVFIQFNRTGPKTLEPLPATHVDTGLGLERIVSVLQGVDSNYKTDLFTPLLDTVRDLTGDSEKKMLANYTPYRVIGDHARAATFLIADGVVPGNMGRGYVTRMIIRRASRFAGKIGLEEPFLAKVAEQVIEHYGEAYPELVKNRAAILDNLTREEERFQRTVEGGIAQLENLFRDLKAAGEKILDGKKAFELYATFGLPLEITRDIAQEQGLDVDEEGFRAAMDEHRQASGAGKAMGEMGGEDVEVYRALAAELQEEGKLDAEGVANDPYGALTLETEILAMVKDGESVKQAKPGDMVDVLLPATPFYVEAGGQIADTGVILSAGEPEWEIRITGTRQPAAGTLVHFGEVIEGEPSVGDQALARVDAQRREDIMRNHTATHLLHAALHRVLGDHARQAGSLVAPDRLRFDFTHPEALTEEELSQIEADVNRDILANHTLNIAVKSLEEAQSEGAIALFGEKYDATVRTIAIGDSDDLFSYELCGGTHVNSTGDIGVFLIVGESGIAAGTRRIEAVTGREAYKFIRLQNQMVKETSAMLATAPDQMPEKVRTLLDELGATRKVLARVQQDTALATFTQKLEEESTVEGITVLAANLPHADSDTLRQLTDRFRQRHPENGVAVLASVIDGRPLVIAAVTEDLTQRGLHAGELVKHVAKPLGGSGGGRPTLAQAGGKDAAKLDEALASVADWVAQNLRDE